MDYSKSTLFKRIWIIVIVESIITINLVMYVKLPKRKNIRLKDYNYNASGYYFITVCTKEKQKILCDIVGTGILDGPQIKFTQYGNVAKRQIEYMTDFYDDIKIDKYVIMPNHVHLLIKIIGTADGPSGTPVPTNSKISNFVGTFKRFFNKQCGKNIWQYRSYDHIIRGEEDYREIWQYIDSNPARWKEDKFYVK